MFLPSHHLNLSDLKCSLCPLTSHETSQTNNEGFNTICAVHRENNGP